jgi:DNA (cytosine-5)-methyltransferase 1
MKLLDLFCGAGGAAEGYHRAGFEVVGVDHKKQKNYPFEFIQMDAFEALDRFGPYFDVIHASPPCQAWVDSANKSKHPQLIDPIRDALKRSGRPYVIENVDSAPLRDWVMLCGTMFGLKVIRHRLFECSPSFYFAPFSCNHWGTVAAGDFAGVYGRGGRGHRGIDPHSGRRMRWGSPPAGAKTQDFWSEAMEIDWMNRRELSQAIPPAYTEYIGNAMRQTLFKAV